MNTVEHIVECYFRICRQCFTMNDVKVRNGNNRQFDLLAVNLLDGSQFHVESAVTHCEVWCPTAEQLFGEFDRKFFGVPPAREGAKTDHSRGKNYANAILETYRSVGLSPDYVQRIYCCWILPQAPDWEEMLRQYATTKAIRSIRVLSFRDEVLPRLEQTIATAHYEDEALRTLSLLRQRDVQVAR